jgi:DNA repair protein SbcC/Rad50
MLTDLIIVNFQSLKNAKFRLGGLTVITGPTGSGKSAAVRALRLAVFNQLGTDFITRGAKEPCKVLVGSQDDGWAVCITRGKTSAKDSYVISAMSPGDSEPASEVFTKLNKEVPAQATALLAVTELCFARQLDWPYLLDESGGKVARVLGDLTNVNVVFEAAREGERQRKEVTRDLRKAEREVAGIADQLQQYAGLPGQRQAITRAGDALDAAVKASQRLARLRELLSALHSAREEAAVTLAAVPVLPSLEAAESLRDRLWAIRSLRQSLATARQESAEAAEKAGQAALFAEKSHETLHEALVAAGECPMCHQAITAQTVLAV